MARQLRIEYPGAIYHIMSRGVNKCATFVDDEDRRFFLELVSKLCNKGALLVHAYSLETNHFHKLAETPVGDLHRWMQWLLTTYTQRFNKRHGRVGGLWQDRYKAILVEDGEYFLTCSRYIHLNPVKDRLVKVPEHYRWSSFRKYVDPDLPADIPLSFDRTLSHFKDREAYLAFVRSGIGEKERDPLWRAKAGIAFGGEEFVKKIQMMVDGRPENHEITSLKQLQRKKAAPTAEEILQATEVTCKQWSRCQRRRMYIYCLDELTWLNRTEIASLTGLTCGAVTHAILCVDQHLQNDANWIACHQKIRGRVL